MKCRRFYASRTTLFFFTLSLIFVVRAFAEEVPRISKEEVRTMLGNPDVTIVDVRLSGDLGDSDSKIKGAVREDPRDVETWIDKYPKDKTLVFYCA